MFNSAAKSRRPGTSALADAVHRTGAATAVWYLRVVACINLLGAVSVSFRQHLHHHGSGDYYTPYLLTAGLASAAFTAFMAVMMRRRKRAAWIANTVLVSLFLLLVCLAMAASPDVRHHTGNWASAVITLGFLLALLLGRSEFRGKGDRSNPWLALAALFGGGAIGVGLGTALVSVTNAVHGSAIGDRAHYVLLRGITLGMDASALPDIDTPRWVDVAINVMGVLVFLLVLYALFRAPRGKKYLSADDEARLRELLEREGEQDSLGYFALRRDKSAVFSPSGKAAVVYRVVGGVSLASGDPIGDLEAWPGAIDAWLEQAREHAWIPAVMGASEAGGTIYGRHGLDALELGDEAIVHVADFSLEGRAMRGVRQAHKRVARAGYTVRVRRHEDIPDPEMSRLLDLADHWRDGQTERGFSMALGRLGDPADGQCVMVECHDADGDLRALLSFVPWGRNGLSLDLMRRDRDADNGLLEYMVLELIARADDVEVQRLSLNFAMFRAVFERGSRIGAGPFLRAWRSVLLFFSRWWQIESLYRANAKYRPTWEPRYLLFESSRDLVRIGLASARAEGFITTPKLPRFLGGRRAAFSTSKEELVSAA